MQTDPDSTILQINGQGACRPNVFSSPSITTMRFSLNVFIGVIFPQNNREGIQTRPINNKKISFPVCHYEHFGEKDALTARALKKKKSLEKV